jgi:hypothetical protein
MILWGSTDCSQSVFTNVVRPVPDEPARAQENVKIQIFWFIPGKFPAIEIVCRKRHSPTTMMVKGTPLTLFPLRLAGYGIAMSATGGKNTSPRNVWLRRGEEALARAWNGNDT